MLYNEINLSVRFQDSFSHVWEHSRFIIGTVIKQTLLHKEALLGKNKIMYSALFLVKSMGETNSNIKVTQYNRDFSVWESNECPFPYSYLKAYLKAWSELYI